ncbi:hypothetical protein PAXINDRAFT_17471 [Paxillus involutus ATCC 200175]|uniref:Uncharacterized protein n=1 Tax=Paxillus involutus ATCC 200175 TaxID=664439 RepID=A0A0C9T115_PAXIN|nr:hypothetical protein PAXINDRAFT_17471 [Paxillus involutus ATCC 200175]
MNTSTITRCGSTCIAQPSGSALSPELPLEDFILVSGNKDADRTPQATQMRHGNPPPVEAHPQWLASSEALTSKDFSSGLSASEDEIFRVDEPAPPNAKGYQSGVFSGHTPERSKAGHGPRGIKGLTLQKPSITPNLASPIEPHPGGPPAIDPSQSMSTPRPPFWRAPSKFNSASQSQSQLIATSNSCSWSITQWFPFPPAVSPIAANDICSWSATPSIMLSGSLPLPPSSNHASASISTMTACSCQHTATTLLSTANIGH